MTWTAQHTRWSLRNDRVSDKDADRQQRTAAEILRRLDDQPGVVLADEVGMGKTYVALAVAVSVLEATRRKRPVVVMVPACRRREVADGVGGVRGALPAPPVTASARPAPVRRGSDFLKLLDDPASSRSHLIFLTHGALTSNLNDPFIRLALLRRAMLRRRELGESAPRRRPVRRLAAQRQALRRRHGQALLDAPIAQWQDVWERRQPAGATRRRSGPVRAGAGTQEGRSHAAARRPRRRSGPPQCQRSSHAFEPHADNSTRHSTRRGPRALRALDEHLPLLVLDEAHHVKNPNRLARLFDNEEAEQDAEALQGPLGNMFDEDAVPHRHTLPARPPRAAPRARSLPRRPLAVRARADALRPADRSPPHRSRPGAGDRAAARARVGRASTRSTARSSPRLASFEPHDDQPEALRTALTIAAEAERDLADRRGATAPVGDPPRQAAQGASDAATDPAGRSSTTATATSACRSTGGATLPFLLAARAQAVAALNGTDGERSTRAYFAYGLASSFEAYADTRRNRVELDEPNGGQDDARDVDHRSCSGISIGSQPLFHDDTADGWASHPKVAATVDRVRELWCNGEKVAGVLLLRRDRPSSAVAHLARAPPGDHHPSRRGLSGWIPPTRPKYSRRSTGSANDCSAATRAGTTRSATRFGQLAADLDDDIQEQVADVAIRFMRTPSFLVRFVDLSPRDVRRRPARRPRAARHVRRDTCAIESEPSPARSDRRSTSERDELLAALDRHPDRRHRHHRRGLRPVGTIAEP